MQSSCRWLSQQHDVPHSLNQIFHPPPDKRSNTVTRNPLHYDRGDFRVSNDYHQIAEDYDNLPVDVHAVNPYYGTDIKINDKVREMVNKIITQLLFCEHNYYEFTNYVML